MQEALESAAALPDEEPDPLRNGELTGTTTPVPTATTFWETIRASATTRVVLPAGEADLERAAERFLDTLTPDQWAQLDQALQDQVLSAQGGLHAALTRGDLLRHVLRPLQDQAASFLSGSLPITDVAQVEFAVDETVDGDFVGRIHTYHAQAEPLIRREAEVASGTVLRPSAADLEFVSGGTRAELQVQGGGSDPNQPTFLLVPASESGKKYAEQAQAELPGVHLVTVPGQADLMFCREQASLRREDLERLVRPCRAAYEESAHVPHTSAHARFDVQEWTPLDP